MRFAYNCGLQYRLEVTTGKERFDNLRALTIVLYELVSVFVSITKASFRPVKIPR